MIFTAGDSDYTVRDVIDAGWFRGKLEPWWKESLGRIEAVARAEEAGSELESSELDAAAVAFRYRYDLITAEETEAWLEGRGLNLTDFSEYFARTQWGRVLGKAKTEQTTYADASAEERELFVVDLIMSGELDGLAERFSWQVAALTASGAPDEEQLAEARKTFLERNVLNEEEIAHWLSGLGRDQAWFDGMIALEAAFRARCATLLTEESRERELVALRLPLTRFEVELIELESRDAAMEAFMCVRDDGMSMEEVAEEGRYPFHQTEMVLEQISEDLQQKFLSLTPGSLLEPTPREDGFLLTKILEKKVPTLAEPDVRARVEQRIMERHFAELTSGRIHWRLAQTATE